jgi:hypothetical protein
LNKEIYDAVVKKIEGPLSNSGLGVSCDLLAYDVVSLAMRFANPEKDGRSTKLLAVANHFAECVVHTLGVEQHSDALSDPLPLYRDHKSSYSTAEQFLLTVYDGRLGADGDLDQSTLRKLDGPLMDALNLEFRGEDRRKELREILPTKSDRLDQRLMRELGYVPQGEERKRALTSLSRGHRVGVRTLKPT